MGVRIKGLDRLNRKLSEMPKALQNATWDATFEITDEVRGRAESELASSVKHGSGELLGSVKNEVETNKDGNLIGRVWSDKIQAGFREFGTGPNGEKSPKDLPDGINPVYRQTPWFIPANEVADLEALYGMLRITINGQDYFKTSGQPARPWLYPSFKSVEPEVPEIYKKHIKEAFRKVVK